VLRAGVAGGSFRPTRAMASRASARQSCLTPATARTVAGQAVSGSARQRIWPTVRARLGSMRERGPPGG
jgi:hypothetical protein